MKAGVEIIGGYSSAGRAPALQAGGRRFDPDYLHHLNKSQNVQNPSRAQRSGSARKRRRSEMNETYCLQCGERYGACVDDGPVAQLARAYD